MTGRQLRNRLSPRARLEAAIEAAIALLDTLDPDPDLEDGHDQEMDRADDEPSLCGIGMKPQGGAGVWMSGQGVLYDLEADGAEG